MVRKALRKELGDEIMRRNCIFHTWDYDAIPWYMLDEDMYTIEEVVYDDYDPALDGSTEYFVYLK